MSTHCATHSATRDPIGRPLGRHTVTRSPFAGALLAGVALVLACGDGPTHPTGGGAIPDQAYEVNVSAAEYNCSVTHDPGAFTFAVFPHRVSGDEYGVYLISDSPVDALLSGDELALSPLPIQLETGVVTLGGRWTFSEDRRSFTGTTTFDVHRNDGATCLFTFKTVGKPVSPPSSTSGSPEGTGGESVSARVASLEGQAFPAHNSGAQCFYASGLYQVVAQPVQFDHDYGDQLLIIGGEGNTVFGSPEFMEFDEWVGWYDANGTWHLLGGRNQDGSAMGAWNEFYGDVGFSPTYKWSPSTPGSNNGWVLFDLLGSNAHGSTEQMQTHLFVPGPGTYWYTGGYVWYGIANLGVAPSNTFDEWRQITCAQ